MLRLFLPKLTNKVGCNVDQENKSAKSKKGKDSIKQFHDSKSTITEIFHIFPLKSGVAGIISQTGGMSSGGASPEMRMTVFTWADCYLFPSD